MKIIDRQADRQIDSERKKKCKGTIKRQGERRQIMAIIEQNRHRDKDLTIDRERHIDRDKE